MIKYKRSITNDYCRLPFSEVDSDAVEDIVEDLDSVDDIADS